jgi:uncharacterized protein YndB with AHSA1/START domain
MSTTIVTPDQDAVVSEIEIAAPAERVFQALTGRQSSSAGSPTPSAREVLEDGRAARRPLSLRHGEGNGRGQRRQRIRMPRRDLEYDPPRLLVYTWVANWHDDKSKRRTVVRWELTPAKTGTHVKVTHSGLAQEEAARKDYSGGWPGVLRRC